MDFNLEGLVKRNVRSAPTSDDALLQSSFGARYGKIEALQYGFQLRIDQALYLRDHGLRVHGPWRGHLEANVCVTGPAPLVLRSAVAPLGASMVT